MSELTKLMIDADGHGFYQADAASPNDAVCRYSEAAERITMLEAEFARVTAERAALQEKLSAVEDQNKDYGEIFDKYEATVTELKAENTRLWGALKEESAEVIHLREFLNANRKYIGDIAARTVRAQQKDSKAPSRVE